jgi:DNA (cytosine-5)-methyltransferase 1
MNATLLSCFSGVGGLDLGLEAAGFVTVGCLEIDPDARRALTANRPNWSLLEPSDVVSAGARLRPNDLGMRKHELTLIAGGPPCQPFSKAALWASPKKGITDIRGTAVGGMLALVDSFLPAVVMMENVAGFLSGEHNAGPMINEAFASINATHSTAYAPAHWVVDAADYGVPQHRRRSILLAFRDGYVQPAVLPTTHARDHRTAWDALGDYSPQPLPPAVGKYADLLGCVPEGSNYQYLTAQGAGQDRELFGYRTRFWSFLLKLAKDRPAWTLPASPGPSTGPFHWDNRPLAASERMLLQGFPPEWDLACGERIGIRLAGNATPPPLGEAIGTYVSAVLAGDGGGKSVIEAPTLATRPREGAPPPAATPAPLPQRWAALVGPREAHPGPGEGPGTHRVGPQQD